MKLEYLMEYTADIQLPPRNTGLGPFGIRGLAVVTGGSFAGSNPTFSTGGGNRPGRRIDWTARSKGLHYKWA